MSGIHQSVISTFITTGPPDIGAVYGGGYFAGQISTGATGVADYNLVVAPRSSGQTYTKIKTSNTQTVGTGSVIDGVSNTNAMDIATHPAANFVKGLTIGGYSDWYIPASKELDVLYFDLKPSFTGNADQETNIYAVPSRPGFSATSVTSATLFQQGNSEAFNNANDQTQYYLSSTTILYGNNTWRAYSKGFRFGGIAFPYLTQNVYLRAIRRVPA